MHSATLMSLLQQQDCAVVYCCNFRCVQALKWHVAHDWCKICSQGQVYTRIISSTLSCMVSSVAQTLTGHLQGQVYTRIISSTLSCMVSSVAQTLTVHLQGQVYTRIISCTNTYIISSTLSCMSSKHVSRMSPERSASQTERCSPCCGWRQKSASR